MVLFLAKINSRHIKSGSKMKCTKISGNINKIHKKQATDMKSQSRASQQSTKPCLWFNNSVCTQPTRLHFSRVLKSASFILKTSIYSFYPPRNMLSLSSPLHPVGFSLTSAASKKNTARQLCSKYCGLNYDGEESSRGSVPPPRSTRVHAILRSAFRP